MFSTVFPNKFLGGNNCLILYWLCLEIPDISLYIGFMSFMSPIPSSILLSSCLGVDSLSGWLGSNSWCLGGLSSPGNSRSDMFDLCFSGIDRLCGTTSSSYECSILMFSGSSCSVLGSGILLGKWLMFLWVGKRVLFDSDMSSLSCSWSLLGSVLVTFSCSWDMSWMLVMILFMLCYGFQDFVLSLTNSWQLSGFI